MFKALSKFCLLYTSSFFYILRGFTRFFLYRRRQEAVKYGFISGNQCKIYPHDAGGPLTAGTVSYTHLLICILKGSVFFTCELAKYITVPVTIDFMSVSSYGNGIDVYKRQILRLLLWIFGALCYRI